MDLWKSLAGMVETEILCADPAVALMQITAANIQIYEIREGNGGFGLILKIRRSDFRKLNALANKRGYECELRSKGGLYWTAKAFLHRPVLMTGILIYFALSLYLPSRVLFYQVEGNALIPDQLILEQCQMAGVGFGSSRREVRSERVKNALLEAIPQLKWVGVNTSGCVATITVKERSEEPEQKNTAGISSIVASRDGIITSCTASKGNLLCKPGQVVTAGEVLISGYTDCGLSIRATRSEGEVYAQTNREITAILPAQFTEIEGIKEISKKYAIIIGKKRINLYKGSGISGASCDKMYAESVLTLPGGFQLPVTLVTETWITRELAANNLSPESGEELLTREASRYLQSVMVAGSVINQSIELDQTEDLYILNSKFACHEMIGQVRNEENLRPYGK